jgi:TPP-dependent pyruvate/acetoin dehydrogenase alpha subunit
VLTAASRDEMRAKLIAEIDEAVEYAVAQPYPVGEQAVEGVYAQ